MGKKKKEKKDKKPWFKPGKTIFKGYPDHNKLKDAIENAVTKAKFAESPDKFISTKDIDIEDSAMSVTTSLSIIPRITTLNSRIEPNERYTVVIPTTVSKLKRAYRKNEYDTLGWLFEDTILGEVLNSVFSTTLSFDSRVCMYFQDIMVIRDYDTLTICKDPFYIDVILIVVPEISIDNDTLVFGSRVIDTTVKMIDTLGVRHAIVDPFSSIIIFKDEVPDISRIWCDTLTANRESLNSSTKSISFVVEPRGNHSMENEYIIFASAVRKSGLLK